VAKRTGFNSERYLEQQTEAILERAKQFGNKLYLEFGGKLIHDMHASRVLPGFDPDGKIQLLQKLKDKAEIVLCIFAGDIERKKIRADFGITYDADAMKLIDDLREWGLLVRAVVITRYDEQPAARMFKNRLERRNVKVYTHRATRGYPSDVDLIVSDEGYGANPFIETERPVVVVTAPGPGSGKLATCLSQLYHEHKRGVNAVYAKFETFPIWNLPLKHPVNVAYEAATADLKDFNLIDPHHLEAYGEQAINYNRDVDAFPLLARIIERITGQESFYKSPTDMGVNRAGFGIDDDEACREAAKQEVIRRYFRCSCEYAMGLAGKSDAERVKELMDQLEIKPTDRETVEPARQAAIEGQQNGKGNEGIYCGAAIELSDGSVVTGKNSALMHAVSALVLNTVKQLAGIPDEIHLLAPNIIQGITSLKKDILNMRAVSLDLEETLIALGVSVTSNPSAQLAMEKLKELTGCELHSTHIPTPGDEAGLRRLGVNATSDPDFATKFLFMR